jgi:iron complex outermembrane receptor protein
VDSDTSGFTQRVTACNPSAVISSSGQTIPTGQYGCAQVARLNAANDFYAVENALPNPSNKLEQSQAINTTTWDLSDHLTVKNIASYAQLRNSSRASVFGNYWIVSTNAPIAGNTARPGFLGQVITPAQITAAPDAPLNHQDTLTEELQVHGTAIDNQLQWQSGLYYERSKPVDGFTGTMGQNNGLCSYIGFDPVTGTPITSQCVLPYNLLSGLSRDVRTTTFVGKAAYAQGTYALTDRLGLTAGLRYTDDESSSTSKNFGYTYFNGNLINTRCTNAGTTLPDCISKQEQQSHATTGVLDLEYRLADDLMTYVKYSRGYRQGIVNPRGVPPYDSIGPESVNTYELGLKSSWDGATPGVLDLAIHYNDFERQQLLISFLNAAGTTNASACACGTSKIYGAELDGGVELFQDFRVTGALAYLHTELLTFQQPALPPGFTQVVVGNTVGSPLTQSPEWKGSLTAAYTLSALRSLGDITTSATYSYSDAYFAKTSSFGRIPSFGTLNLNVNWQEIGGGPVDVSLFATNVTDKEYYTFATDLYASSLGFVSQVQGLPRMYGASVRYRFGAE